MQRCQHDAYGKAAAGIKEGNLFVGRFVLRLFRLGYRLHCLVFRTENIAQAVVVNVGLGERRDPMGKNTSGVIREPLADKRHSRQSSRAIEPVLDTYASIRFHTFFGWFRSFDSESLAQFRLFIFFVGFTC